MSLETELGQTRLERDAWRAECEKWRETAQAQARRLELLEQQLATRDRQTAKKGKR